MKIKSLLIGMLACSAMVACTNEDPIDNGNENTSLNGEKGYLKVKLVNTTGSVGRAAEDGGFENGTANENAVKKVDFFFYNKGEFWKTANETELSWSTSNGNVEKIADAVVVLTGLTSTDYPNSVLALVNADEELVAKLNKKEVTLAKAAEIINESTTTDNGFLMINSSFLNENTGEGETATAVNELSSTEATTCAATQITLADFVLESSDEALNNANTVNIYVERLAAKVRVDVSPTANTSTKDGVTLFDLGEYPVKSSSNDLTTTTTTKLYAKVKGWHLNATTKETNLIKNIKGLKSPFDEQYAFDWNDAANYRSYWGKSTNYGKTSAIYPDGFADAIGTDGVVNTEKDADDDADGAELNYYNWSQLNNAMGGYEYCMENTNTLEVLNEKFYSAVTQVVVGAQITDANGQAVSLVRYNRTLYTPATFKARVLNEINLDYYKKVGEKYQSFGAGDIKEQNIYDGKVTMVVSNEDETWYTRTAATGAEGEVSVEGFVYTEIAEDAATPASRLEAIAVEAEYYNNGMMHYVVPLQHLRQSDNNLWTNGSIDINEAEYGIVRNHVYDLTINKIEKLGTSVYDENEDIIKQTKDEKTYLIAAQLNILSWKVVNQGVDL